MTATVTSTPLTAADRCDRCGAAARMLVTLPTGGELLFCGHHGNQHRDRLRELDATIATADA